MEEGLRLTSDPCPLILRTIKQKGQRRREPASRAAFTFTGAPRPPPRALRPRSGPPSSGAASTPFSSGRAAGEPQTRIRTAAGSPAEGAVRGGQVTRATAAAPPAPPAGGGAAFAGFPLALLLPVLPVLLVLLVRWILRERLPPAHRLPRRLQSIQMTRARRICSAVACMVETNGTVKVNRRQQQQ
ncbi:hypothetical protein EYF80_054815 [Liparis tanakae]|uniref:Uncharacterized protein n=1 Tax=Liparis tanakae TaxID=230148 RepID=A0A4Z2F1W0_9TELE|nr:hypothetical protein EYF80_054815 [Liparis tanakae]